MKNLYVTLLILFISFLSVQAQQTFECNDISIDISAVQCENNNNDDPSDDYLTFVLTVTDENNNTNSSFIQNLPVNSTSRDNEGNMRNVDSQGDDIFINELNSPYTFNVPSMDCADVPFNLTIDEYTNNTCVESGLLSAIRAPIPTLGQWAIIILGLSLCVIGVVFVRKEMVSRQAA